MIGVEWYDGTLYIYRQGRWCLALTPPRLYLSRHRHHPNKRTDLLPHAIDANGWCHNHTHCSTYLDDRIEGVYAPWGTTSTYTVTVEGTDDSQPGTTPLT